VHAYFFARLYAALPNSARYLRDPPIKIRVCRIQKEYPTPTRIQKSRRQGWDICLLRDPWRESKTAARGLPHYDRLDTEAIIEFGLNATRAHLCEDLRRLAHPDVCAERRYAVHLLRVSESSSRVSRRDISRNARPSIDAGNLSWIQEAMAMAATPSVTVLLCRPDPRAPQLWRISAEKLEDLSRWVADSSERVREP
jgi:hypothetical protein